MTTEIAKLLAEKAPLPKGTHIVSRIGGRAVGGTHELKDFVLAGANRVPNTMSEDEPFWIHGWRDLHDELSVPVVGAGGESVNSEPLHSATK